VDRIKRGDIEKGDPISIASIAGVLAAKNTPNIVLLCHPLPLTNVEVTCRVEDEEHIGCTARVSAVAKTGVEMEALAAVASALLNIWDVVKKYEKDEEGQYPYTRIEEIRVLEKRKEPAPS
jgi:cyclic pyranopterin phosphate synthase